ncbi:hypothetical protein AFLA70_372g001421 [Aspergillus flavus AF70]|nr:hypothetical protein AFLA70_372g001421 [Aspergillus flavus AF70]
MVWRELCPASQGPRVKSGLSASRKPNSAIELLAQRPEPSAILVTDEALTLPENRAVWKAALEYVRRGGTAVIMGHFPSFVRPNHLKPFFSQAGLNWESGSYQRTTLALNPAAVSVANAEKLPQRYSQKAVFVKNVAPGEMWYKTDDDSVVQSMVFPATKVNMAGETAVALAKVGTGKARICRRRECGGRFECGGSCNVWIAVANGYRVFLGSHDYCV